MRAVTVARPGGVENLAISEVPDLEPGPGQLLVRNFATALNRADLLQRRGLYPPPAGESEILGLEFAGEVARTGADVEGFRTGDRVFGLLGGGGYAEQVVVDQRMAMPVPDHFSYDLAAAVPEVFFTAHENLFTLGRLAPGERVLIHAGASGVGTAAIQLARLRGAQVLATAGSPEKLRVCRELGADRAINYRDEDFASVVEQVTGNEGVDVILDLVGAPYWERNLRSLGPGGRLLVVGLLGGARVETDLGVVLRRRIQIIGSALCGRSREDKVAITGRFRREVLPLLERGEARPIIDRVFPIEEVEEAHRRMEQNLNCGKIVLRL
ncbi:MAG: NAD(P)H-quinone oxidoreductase [Planctomycetota bacterium]|nr:NAD(P)H-quinone oxidoreductase [Planctomycetota bacterium]